MNCQNIQAKFDERLDSQLTDISAREFDGHLAGCPDCRREWQTYQAAWGLIAKHQTIEPSFGFAQRTLRQLHETSATVRLRFWQLPAFRWATAGGLAVAIAVGGLLTWQRMETRHAAEVYADVHQDRLDDIDVIAALDKLEGDSSL